MSAIRMTRWRARDWGLIGLGLLAAFSLAIGVRHWIIINTEPDYSDAPIERSYYAIEGGWHDALPEEVGLATLSLRSADAYFRSSGMAATGLLVVRDNRLVWHMYYPGHSVSQIITVPVYEGTRIVTATMVGAALQAGYLESVDQTVGEFFPEHFAAHPNPAFESVTIRDLLTNQSGIGWTEYETVLRPDRDTVTQLLELPLVAAPGESYNRSAADAHLLMGILDRATGEDLMDFAGEYVFEPLGIIERQWQRDSVRRPIGAAGLELRPPSIATLGQLYLNDGYYNGVQILPRGWVEEATQPYVQVQAADPATGKPEISQGYMWLISEQNGSELWMSVGYGGQFTVVLPEFDMVVVAISDTRVPQWQNPDFLNIEGLMNYDLFGRYYVPMARGEGVPPAIVD